MRTYTTVAILILFFLTPSIHAQQLVTTEWQSYGISFKAPADFSVEDDSEEGYIIADATYYITVQMLDGDGLKPSELSAELKSIATDDEVTHQSAVASFDLPSFHVVWLKGNCETDQCIYSYLMAKDGSYGMYVSITYKTPQDKIPEEILRSFQLKDE